MDKDSINYGWDFFEDLYNNTLRQGQTFSSNMSELIQKEIDKMYKQRDEWLKEHSKEKSNSDEIHGNGD